MNILISDKTHNREKKTSHIRKHIQINVFNASLNHIDEILLMHRIKFVYRRKNFLFYWYIRLLFVPCASKTIATARATINCDVLNSNGNCVFDLNVAKHCIITCILFCYFFLHHAKYRKKFKFVVLLLLLVLRFSMKLIYFE